MTSTEKAAAERDRKARIRRAQEHLAGLPEDERQHVVESATEKEEQAKAGGSRRAHVAFVEDALVAWSIGGTMMAAGEKGVDLTPEQVDEIVRAASAKYRGGDVVIPDTTEDVTAALYAMPAKSKARAAARKATASAQVTVPADATPAQLGAAANRLAEGLVDDLKARAVALRAKGLTVAEVAAELSVNPALARDLCGTAGRGGSKQVARDAKESRRQPREARGTGTKREEKCPGCGEWRPAEQDAEGRYVREADFREGRGDCRSCYNRRWLEGKARREAARKAVK